MIITYNDIKLKLSLADRYHQSLVKFKVKRLLSRFIPKYKKQLEENQIVLSTVISELKGIENPVFIDVGCNIGAVSLPVAKRMPSCQVYSIDAHPVALSGFVKNQTINRLKNVKVIGAAISSSQSIAKIFTEPKNSGGNRLSGFEGRTDIDFSQVVDEIFVPSLTMNAVFKNFEINKCDVLKIDVEGYEIEVLKSFDDESLSPKRIPVVICEYGPEGLRSAGYTGWDMVQLMNDHGYKNCVDLKTKKPIMNESDIPKLGNFEVTDFKFF
jgi:FkbM family methyltransferase